VSSPPRIRVHLVPWTDDPWDVEESLFSLVAQERVALSVHLHPGTPPDPSWRSRWERLFTLGDTVRLRIGDRLEGPWEDAEAVAIWVAGTIATPDHLGRAHHEIRAVAAPVVAPMRRVRRRPVQGGPPYVLGKSRRAAPATLTLDELEEDPAFLGRCLFPEEGLPGWIPRTPEEHRRWAALAWSRARPVRIAEPPLVDLPDLRPRPVTRWRDLRAELDHQIPRWLERRIPVAFTHGHRWMLRLGRLPGRIRSLWRR